MATLIPVEMTDQDGEPVEKVQASYADFLWGVPEEVAPIYPSLGFSTTKGEDGRRKIIHVAEGTPAEAAGFEIGDVVMTLEGKEIRSRGDVSRLMAEKRWGDALSATVKRGEETVEIEVLLRRTVDEDEEDEDRDGDEDEDA